MLHLLSTIYGYLQCVSVSTLTDTSDTRLSAEIQLINTQFDLFVVLHRKGRQIIVQDDGRLSNCYLILCFQLALTLVWCSSLQLQNVFVLTLFLLDKESFLVFYCMFFVCFFSFARRLILNAKGLGWKWMQSVGFRVAAGWMKWRSKDCWWRIWCDKSAGVKIQDQKLTEWIFSPPCSL